VSAAVKGNEAAGCFDFWLARYQTITTGALSLAAAILAASMLWRQIKVSESQANVMAGLIEPDFWAVPISGMIKLYDHPELCGFEVHCINHGRRIIELTAIAIVRPAIASCDVRWGGVRLVDEQDDGSMKLRIRIPGSRPSAPEATEFGELMVLVRFADLAETYPVECEIRYRVFASDVTYCRRTITFDPEKVAET
jgi:hypothetical protein